jgi:ABC-2 type transport system permease protein
MSWFRVWTVMRRHAYVLWRAPHRWFDIAFWPFMDVVLWGSLGAFVAKQDQSSQAATPYLLGGIVMFHILFQSQIAVATGFMEETWSRNLLNVMTTPVTEVEYVVGTAAFGVLKVMAALTTLSLTAFGFFRFGLGEIGWSMVPIALVLTMVGWAVGVANIGMLLRWGQSAEILCWGMNFVLMAFSGVFNPVESLPGVFQPIAKALPSTHAFSALRQVLDGQPLPTDQIWIGLGSSVLWLAGGIAFSTWMLRVFRNRGFVTRFS